MRPDNQMGLSEAYRQLLSLPGEAKHHPDHHAHFSPGESTAQGPPGVE